MNDDWTTLEDALGQLPRAKPDAARAQHVRERCHRTLTRTRGLPVIARSATVGRALESAVVGGFCAVYFSLLTLIALRTHGLL